MSAWRKHPKNSPARPHRSQPTRASSTFSCDIAYSDSPTASRASSRSSEASHANDLALAEGVDAALPLIGDAAGSVRARGERGRRHGRRGRRHLDSTRSRSPRQATQSTSRHDSSRPTPSVPCRSQRSGAHGTTRRRARKLRDRVDVALGRRLDSRAHDLHVLLRHRLLRQAAASRASL